MPSAGTPIDEGNIHNLKDILSVYNKITESCFSRCASNFNQRHLTNEEERCVENCSGKFIKGNHSIMSTFMEIQTHKQQQMMEELTQQQMQQHQQNIQQLMTTKQQPSAEQPSQTTQDSPTESWLKGAPRINSSTMIYHVGRFNDASNHALLTVWITRHRFNALNSGGGQFGLIFGQFGVIVNLNWFLVNLDVYLVNLVP